MAKQNSFDVVSQVDMAEVKNAVNQASKEVAQRYDLKNSNASIELVDKERHVVVTAPEGYAHEAVVDILRQKLSRRGVSLKAMEPGPVQPASGDNVRQVIGFQNGIPTDKAKEIVKAIKNSKLKVQASIQEDSVRVAGKDRDTLQDVIAMLKEGSFDIDMQFTNYR